MFDNKGLMREAWGWMLAIVVGTSVATWASLEVIEWLFFGG